MASAELEVQSKIIMSVRKDGGYARKASNRFMIGIPDLVIALPPFAPCMVEVKDFGVVTDDFDRKVGVTPKQSYEMMLISKAYEDANLGRTAFVAVSLVHKGKHRLVLAPHNIQRLSHAYEKHPCMWTDRQVRGYYRLEPMLRFWKAAQCRLPHHL